MEELKYSLQAERTDEGILISGRTFASKELLKEMGARWNPERKAWILPSDTDLSTLRIPPPEKKVRLEERLPRPWWFCGCKDATIISTQRMMHSCQECVRKRNPDDYLQRGHTFMLGTPYRQDD